MTLPRDPVIDVHAHALARTLVPLVADRPGFAAEQRELARQFGAESLAINADRFTNEWLAPLTDVGVRLSAMDAAGVDVQLVSISPTQYHYWADESLAGELVATANAELAAIVAQAPERLAGLATVALQHPTQAAEQLDHAVTELGMCGVQIGSRAGERDFSDPELDVFWATAERLRAFVFVHPWGCTLPDRLRPYYLGNVIGQPLETTVALSHLIFGGVLDRHPGLLVCGAHGGGYLPLHLGRADHAYEVRPESRTMLRRPSEYLRSIYYDSLVHHDDTLRLLVATVGADRVVLGTDFPFDMGTTDPLTPLAGLPPVDRRLITGGTIAGILAMNTRVELSGKEKS